MQFIDEALIRVRSGKGGDGCVSFRREKYVPRGGPDGGDGGRGGRVILETSKHLSTLLDFKYRKEYIAKRGQHGRGKKRHGKQGVDLVVFVPEGTVVKDDNTGEVLADLVEQGEQFVAAEGGAGGRGNARFATATDQIPDYAEEGEAGEERTLRLELVVIATVGIVGKPNAGKSTLLRRISRARPKVAAYPFTTLAPVLGVATHMNSREIVVAEIPGILEGASEGIGLGTRFLKHLRRTKVLVMMIDASAGTSAILNDMKGITREIANFDASMLARPSLILLNKIDLSGAKKYAESAIDTLGYLRENVLLISAATGEGVDRFIDTLIQVIDDEEKK